MSEHRYYVYILVSASRRAMYIGVARDLVRRVAQHKLHLIAGFSDDYNATRLVYYEVFSDVHRAIAREKQLKRWRREKKNWLVERENPTWRDLAADWIEPQGPSTPPSLRSGSARDDRPGGYRER